METIIQCNKLFAEKTLHPLASIIDMSAPCSQSQVHPDSYCIVIKETVGCLAGASGCGSQCYGLRSCDFTAATIVFNTPTKVVDIRHGKEYACKGHILLFHPSLLVGTPLGRRISGYTFFKYRKDEALHVSAAELRKINRVVGDIEHELKCGIDEYSATILSNGIELLLNYCLRFYHRQFVMRHDANPGEFVCFANMIDDYLMSGRVRRAGMPCGACRFSAQMGMSAAYLSDLVRNETGKSVTDYAQLRRVELAKQLIIADHDSDAKIALMLGYANVAEFRSIFERLTGLTTEQYRNA